MATTDWCPNKCSGRGTCVRGFCHCQPPHFGIDCSKNATFVAHQQPPYSGRLKVYVYDLPSHVAFQDGYFPGGCAGQELAAWAGAQMEALLCMCAAPTCTEWRRRPGTGWQGDHHEHYLGFWLFLQRLLNDTAIRTDDPYEANLFYVPALTYYYSSNTGDPGEHIKAVVK